MKKCILISIIILPHMPRDKTSYKRTSPLSSGAGDDNDYVATRSLLDGRLRPFSVSDVPGRIQGSVATVSTELWWFRLWGENCGGGESSDRCTSPKREREERDRDITTLILLQPWRISLCIQLTLIRSKTWERSTLVQKIKATTSLSTLWDCTAEMKKSYRLCQDGSDPSGDQSYSGSSCQSRVVRPATLCHLCSSHGGQRACWKHVDPDPTRKHQQSVCDFKTKLQSNCSQAMWLLSEPHHNNYLGLLGMFGQPPPLSGWQQGGFLNLWSPRHWKGIS